MTVRWIAWRVILEILRDRRTVAFFVLVPIIVMTLIYYAIGEEEQARLGIVTRGAARLFEYNLVLAIEEEENVEIVSLDIPDEETDPENLRRLIQQSLLGGEADGILYMDERLLVDRFDGKRGTLWIYLEGSRPTLSATVLSAISSAMDDLASSLPVVIDATCSAECANSVNNKPMELERVYQFGSEDLRMIDFFLPVLPPFFVFFFTFIISTISFQRERVRGTLERLLVAPVHFHQIVLGYIGGFFIFSTVQSLIVVSFLIALIGFPLHGLQLVGLAVLVVSLMIIALLMGLLASFLAHNEFQAIQFIPMVILPQVFLSDIIWDIRSFPVLFQWISSLLPLTHVNIAMRNVVLKNQPLLDSWPQLLALAIFGIVILGLLMILGAHSRREMR